jgi:hypothetical protein
MVVIAKIFMEHDEQRVERGEVATDVADSTVEMHLQQSLCGLHKIGRTEEGL